MLKIGFRTRLRLVDTADGRSSIEAVDVAGFDGELGPNMSEATRARKIIIPGGSGQVGTLLAAAFHKSGHDVVVLSRKPTSAPWRVIAWDADTLGGWAAELEG